MANDLNGEIINLFRILQRHYPQLMDVMRFQITSRVEFERLRRVDPSTLTDLERAARFLYLQRLAFGGQLGGVFGVSPGTPVRFNLMRLAPLLEAAHDRLAHVVFEQLDWKALIDRYDSDDTLFYLDPPYFGNEADYGKGLFARSDFQKMSNVLAGIRGRFVLSINDTPETRRIFGDFHIEPVRLKYTVSAGETNDAAELVVMDQPVRLGLFG